MLGKRRTSWVTSMSPGSTLRWYAAAGLALLLLGFVFVHAADPPRKPKYSTWSDFGGWIDSMQYSALKQVNPGNVSQLEQAWFHPAPGPSGRFAFNPLVVDDVMYVVGQDSAIVALDAVTGRPLWSRTVEGRPTNR